MANAENVMLKEKLSRNGDSNLTTPEGIKLR